MRGAEHFLEGWGQGKISEGEGKDLTQTFEGLFTSKITNVCTQAVCHSLCAGPNDKLFLFQPLFRLFLWAMVGWGSLFFCRVGQLFFAEWGRVGEHP